MDLVFYFAYLDPGTGSLIIQSLIGAIAGVAVFGRRMLIGLKMKFNRGQGVKTEDQPTKTDDTSSK